MDAILGLEGVTVNFSGYRALDALDFRLQEGELHFVIGPNGAGKTTLLDVISGKVRPSRGRVYFMGRPITALQEHHIVRMGIARKFQAPSVFGTLTVYENLELAAGFRDRLWRLLGEGNRARRRRVESVLETIGLASKADWLAGSLSHGEKQWLEIGMLLVQDPRVLLLDEPVAGMTRAEREKTGELLRSIARDRSVIVVEHDMDVVRRFSTRVTVLHEGRVLSEGSIAEVQRDPRVVETYLGRSCGPAGGQGEDAADVSSGSAGAGCARPPRVRAGAGEREAAPVGVAAG